MPLSENEQKMLEQMERALHAEDPRFATQMRGQDSDRPSRKRLILGGLAAVAGLALVVAGVATRMTWLGVIGFIVMVAGVAWAFTSNGKGTAKGEKSAKTGGPGRRPRTRGGRGSSSAGFSQRLEERWEKRRRDGGR